MPRTYRHLIRLLRAERPDALLAYTIKPVIYGSLAARAAGVPRVCALITGLGFAFHGDGLRHRLASAVATALYRRALAFDHRVLFPYLVALSVGTAAVGVLVAWTGWIGQQRAMLGALEPSYGCTVEGTLFDGDSCRMRVQAT